MSFQCVCNFGPKILHKYGKVSFLFNKKYATEATFELTPCIGHKLDALPPTTATMNKDVALKCYENMTIIRKLENASANLYKSKYIRGFCHLYSGQEAVAVGIQSVLRPDDSIITSYRSHGWTYLMGCTATQVLAELTGKVSGCVRGKGGSMHMYADRFYGGNGIVGAQVPLGTGIAFAKKYRNKKGICFTLYGDGASNQGQVFEAYNIAKLWNIPVVYICENNHYGMGTADHRSSANIKYYTRGDYIPGFWVDGMDVVAVREATKYCQNYCDSGKGPLVLEMSTYRYMGHSMSDPGVSYRTREEVQQVRKTRDPIKTFKEKILSKGLVTADDIKKIDAAVKKLIANAVDRSKKDKETSMDDLTGDIYSVCLEKNIRNCSPFRALPHKRIGNAVNLK